MINAAAAHDIEVLGLHHLRRLGVVERAGKAHAIKRILFDAVYHLGRRDAHHVIDGRHDVVHVQKL